MCSGDAPALVHEDIPDLLDGGNWASGLTHLIAVEGNRWPDP